MDAEDKKEERSWVMAVDDDESTLRLTEQLLEEEGLKVVSCSRGKEAISKFNEKIYTVVLDITLPDISGLDVFAEIKEKNPLVPVILFTGTSDRWERIKVRRTFRPHAYILKGGSTDELVDTVVGAVQSYCKYLEVIRLGTALERFEKENISLREELGRRFGFQNIYTRDPRMREILQQAEKASKVPYAVLITGNSGTGKELLAKAIHYTSPRADKPFVVLNCAAIPKELIESELFGHEKGSFTGAIERKIGLFETADRGTIFLDEIGDLSASAQAKMLRILQEKEFQRVGGTESIRVDARVLAATNKNLPEEIKNNNFREDLFYRLNAVSIHLPPLKERKGDIPLLIDRFLKKSSQELKKRIRGISPECMGLMEAYDWPGNIRELQNVVERLVTLAENDIITEDLLPPELLASTIGLPHHYKNSGKLYQTIHALERDIITTVLKEAGGNKSKVAEILGISRPLLYKKMELYGLTELAQ